LCVCAFWLQKKNLEEMNIKLKAHSIIFFHHRENFLSEEILLMEK
jgi:hypothetical protein